ncbi:signal peptidase I [Cohnella soli]|uniref:Signal peptidase I n=1 Tax=Cohnella soli TaxID=425005 RepID=A0ABW0HY85_9BACL
MKKAKTALVAALTLGLLLSGCMEKRAVMDETTVHDLPIIDTLQPNQRLHKMNNDAMAGAKQFAASTVVVDLAAYDRKSIARGDVVYYETDAGNPLSGFDVGRVVGLPGEKVKIRDGRISIDGCKLDTPYGSGPQFSNTDIQAEFDRNISVPDNNYFIIGDVWDRNFSGGFVEGTIPSSRVHGQVIGWLGSTLDDVVPPLDAVQFESVTSWHSLNSNLAKLDAILKYVAQINWHAFGQENALELLTFLYNNRDAISATGKIQLMRATDGLDGALSETYAAIVGEWYSSDRPHMIQSLAVLPTDQRSMVAAYIAKQSGYGNLEQTITETNALLDAEWINPPEKSVVEGLLAAFEKERNERLQGSDVKLSKEAPTKFDEQSAQSDVDDFIAVLKADNADALDRLLSHSKAYADYGLEEAKEIIRGFRENFDLPKLIAVPNPSGPSQDPGIGQFEFQLDDGRIKGDKSSSEADKSRVLTLRYGEDGAAVFGNPYVHYFPFAERMAQQYLELVRGNKAEELAGFLNPDDLEIPVEVAKRTIGSYGDAVELKSAVVRYVRGFDFVVKDKKGASHSFSIVYGDGLMGIKDEFVEYPG